jgi:hypothetical protein
MSSQRASVFDQGPDIDISGFKPRTVAKLAAQPAQVKAISETASFVSREPSRTPLPAATPATREPRRHRTGRNIQQNIKARAETIDRFYAIADRNGWVLGETFERAIAALERDLASGDAG